MGTTRIKVIDLSSDQQQVKTSRKHAEKLTGVGKLKKAEQQKGQEKPRAAQVQESDQPETQQIPEVKEQETEIKETTSETKAPKQSFKKPSGTHHTGAKYQKAHSQVEDKTYTAKEAFAL